MSFLFSPFAGFDANSIEWSDGNQFNVSSIPGLDGPLPSELPVLPLRNMVGYPLTVVPIRIGRPRSLHLVDDVVTGNRLMVVVAGKDPEVEEPGPDDVYRIGTVVVVHRLFKAPDNTVTLMLQGLTRVRVEAFTATEPYLRARITSSPETVEEGIRLEALQRSILESFHRLAELLPTLPQELTMMVLNAEGPLQLAYVLATHMQMSLEQSQHLLEVDSASEKLRIILGMLTHEAEVAEIGQKIQSEAQSEIEKGQREYYLRQQMEAIRKELGEASEQQVDVNEFRQKIDAAGMPDEARQEAERELDRLAKIPVASAEYGVIRTYLDWLTSLPWQIKTEDNLDIANARRVLEEDHYDLQEIKQRILEYLAVRRLRQERGNAEDESAPVDYLRREREGAILCFVGPPGTGKTSLGRSIARALGRKFVRQSLGGVRDEAEIRGHRRTYIGALPGRIIQALRRVGVKNPVFMLDEVDKLGMDYQGDPTAALLEVLDPEQNAEFRDHYLDVPFDLSEVLFITTANWMDPIPAPLLDRMEVITLVGYTDTEKRHIARRYLLPRQLRENGLKSAELTITDSAIQRIIQEYTREAGVRNLERELARICRKVATDIAEGKRQSAARVTTMAIPKYLGPRRYFSEAAQRTAIPGVATGLAWTPTGGEMMFIEATRMPGGKELTITGKLGEVMRESAQAALSYVRANAESLGISPNFFAETDLHLHFPAGAVPKDGPSAGVTIVAALVSLLTGRRVRPDVAMTGEITLRGQVLPIGGVKEKALAAHRAGIKTVILPRDNKKDMEEVPPEVQRALHFMLVERVDEVLEAALEPLQAGVATPKEQV